MEKSEEGFTNCQLWDSLLNSARLVCFSKQGKTRMVISTGKTYVNKLRMQLTFLNQRQMALRLAFFCLTTLPATRNEPRMLSQQERCQKTHVPVRHGSDTLSDAYTVQRTHTKTKTKPSYVPATFRDRKQMSAEGSNA